MSRDYVLCPECGDMLPEWMDGTWTCDCGRTSIEVDLRVDCPVCGASVKEYDAAMTSYESHHPNGGGLRTYLNFCPACSPGLYQVLVVEAEGAYVPYPGEVGDRYLTSEDVVASWLADLPKVLGRTCGCGETEWVGGLVIPVAEALPGDETLGDGDWVLRPLCIGCIQDFKKARGLRS